MDGSAISLIGSSENSRSNVQPDRQKEMEPNFQRFACHSSWCHQAYCSSSTASGPKTRHCRTNRTCDSWDPTTPWRWNFSPTLLPCPRRRNYKGTGSRISIAEPACWGARSQSVPTTSSQCSFPSGRAHCTSCHFKKCLAQTKAQRRQKGMESLSSRRPKSCAVFFVSPHWISTSKCQLENNMVASSHWPGKLHAVCTHKLHGSLFHCFYVLGVSLFHCRQILAFGKGTWIVWKKIKTALLQCWGRGLQKICLRTMKSRHSVACAFKYHTICLYLHGVLLSVALTTVSDIKQSQN